MNDTPPQAGPDPSPCLTARVLRHKGCGMPPLPVPAWLDKHPYFTRWTDPQSGVASYLLTERLAPLLQSFYFTNRCLSPDQRLLWFLAGFPPSPSRTLGVVGLDPERPFIRHFPQAQFNEESPMVDPEGNGIFFCARESVWHMDLEGKTRAVCTLGNDYIQNRQLRRLATHLSLSADGRFFLLDGEVGNHWFVGLGDRASGEVRILKEFAHHHNHAQFSPVDPELFTIAQDWFHDKVSGRRFHYDNRIWLMDVHNRRFEGLTPDTYCGHLKGISHEWWSKDGRICWVDYDQGAFEYDLETRQATRLWARPLCHVHCNDTRELWCADQSPYFWRDKPCEVLFLDRNSGRESTIASALPLPGVPRGWYHIDPHPQFSPQGDLICYTSTALGGVDVALCPVAPLLAKLD